MNETAQQSQAHSEEERGYAPQQPPDYYQGNEAPDSYPPPGYRPLNMNPFYYDFQAGQQQEYWPQQQYMAPASVRDNPRLGLYGNFSWVFVLDEQTAGETRLIVRTRASYGPFLFRALTLPLLYPGDFLVARMMLRTIRQRVEQGTAGHQATQRAEATANG